MTIFVVSCEGNQFFRLNYKLLLLVFEMCIIGRDKEMCVIGRDKEMCVIGREWVS